MIVKGFALFDLDGTIIQGDSILPMIRYAMRTKFAKKTAFPKIALAFLGYSLHLINDTKAKEMSISFLQGKTTNQVQQFAESFCRDVLVKRIYPGARAEISARREEGLGILVVTASPDFYLQPLIKELGLQCIIGTRADVTAEGIYTGRISGFNCRNMEKPLRIAEYLASSGIAMDTDISYSYGDSGHDWPMMSLPKHTVAVNAKKALLRRFTGCRQEHWRL